MSTQPGTMPQIHRDDDNVSDVLVVFGITGDLARVMTYQALYRLERRGLLDCPVVGVAFDDGGRLARVHPHDPSWQAWPALEHAVMKDIVPDFPLINKSFNLSYSGADL